SVLKGWRALWRAIVVSALRTGVQHAQAPQALAHGGGATVGEAFDADLLAVTPSCADDQAGRCTGRGRQGGKQYSGNLLSERHFHIDLSIVHDWTD
ncbi:MAG: hypothetical protein ACN6RF_04485, partial [Stenotrophomonas sp.]